MTDYAVARRNMVESQIRPNKVTDPALLRAMESIPRELFLPAEKRSIAYVDEDIELGAGRYLMEPMVLARLIQIVEPEPDSVALFVGCGPGYAPAVLARLCAIVVGVETDAALAASATGTLTELGIDNALIVEGELDAGYAKQAPYDVVLFGGAIVDVPAPVAAQLGDGGRAAAVVRRGGGPGQAHLFTKTVGVVSGRPVFDAATPYLPGFQPEEQFVF